MAESLIAIGGIASVTQLLVYIIHTTETVNKFCENIRDAPEQLQRTNDRLSMLRNVIQELHTYQQFFDDNLIIPPGLRQALFEAVKQTDFTVTRIQSMPVLQAAAASRKSLAWRVKWAARTRHKLESSLSHLEHCESLLGNALELINL